MDQARYKWALTPSKFAGATGCPVFEEDESYGKKYKDRGTDLHKLVEFEDLSLDGLDEVDKADVLFCREDTQALRAAVELEFEGRELLVDKCDEHPRAKLDWIGVTKDGLLIVRDYKFGEMEVPPPRENPQIRAYAFIAWCHMTKAGHAINRVQGGIVHPRFCQSELEEFGINELQDIQKEMFAANDRYIDPFREPDASDPTKCRRCAHAYRCPKVTKAVATFSRGAGLLPMPEAFEPGAIVSIRDRVIAQDLAVILETWAARIKALNKEYAAQNGNTLGGVWNLSTRSNGMEIDDIGEFAEELVKENLMADPMSILQFVKLKKPELIKGLSSPDVPESSVAYVVKQLEEKLGIPRPPVQVFRRGGKKQAAPAERLLDLPMLENPFKAKKEAEPE